MNWKIKRTLAENVNKDIYCPDPADTHFVFKGIAAMECLWYIAEDLAEEGEDWSPKIVRGSIFTDYALQIKQKLIDGEKVTIGYCTWEIVNA